MEDLRRKNRRTFAERFGWPAGVLKQCEAMDADWPDWHVSWRDGKFYVTVPGTEKHPQWLAAETTEELARLMDANRPEPSVKPIPPRP